MTSFGCRIFTEVISSLEWDSDIKKNEIRPFTATWMDLEMVILGGVSQAEKRQISYKVTYMWNLFLIDFNLFLTDTNELYKIETDTNVENKCIVTKVET